MPLKELNLSGTKVTDLTPIKDMQLTRLDVGRTKVNDLSPLKGMPLGYLAIDGTPVSDLSPLRGMPLTAINLADCAKVTDLSPLADSTQLTRLNPPPNFTDDQLRRAIPKLQNVGDALAWQFWMGQRPWLNRSARISNIK